MSLNRTKSKTAHLYILPGLVYAVCRGESEDPHTDDRCRSTVPNKNRASTAYFPLHLRGFRRSKSGDLATRAGKWREGARSIKGWRSRRRSAEGRTNSALVIASNGGRRCHFAEESPFTTCGNLELIGGTATPRGERLMSGSREVRV